MMDNPDGVLGAEGGGIAARAAAAVKTKSRPSSVCRVCCEAFCGNQLTELCKERPSPQIPRHFSLYALGCKYILYMLIFPGGLRCVCLSDQCCLQQECYVSKVWKKYTLNSSISDSKYDFVAKHWAWKPKPQDVFLGAGACGTRGPRQPTALLVMHPLMSSGVESNSWNAFVGGWHCWDCHVEPSLWPSSGVVHSLPGSQDSSRRAGRWSVRWVVCKAGVKGKTALGHSNHYIHGHVVFKISNGSFIQIAYLHA